MVARVQRDRFNVFHVDFTNGSIKLYLCSLTQPKEEIGYLFVNIGEYLEYCIYCINSI